MRRLLTILGVALVASVLVVACSDEAPEAFSFADDDLCEWIGERDVARIVEEEFGWVGTVTAFDDETGCRWELSDPDGGRGFVRAADAGAPGASLDRQLRSEGAAQHRGGHGVCVGEFVVGHPALSKGVVAHNGGFGQFMFGVPNETGWLHLDLSVPGRTDDDWTSCEGTTGGVATEAYEARYFAVADRVLEQLGWVSDR